MIPSAFGRRIEKISPTATSIFAYDGDNLVETVNASGGEVARYTQGQNIDEPLAMQRGSTTDYYEADGLGSITSVTASNATIAQSYTYDSFGNTTNSSGSLTNFFRYTAREFDTETNLYYYRARYYDPATSTFVSEDPCRSEVGLSWYEYVENNPSDYGDWNGCKGTKIPPPNLPKGTPNNLISLFNNGWNAMLNRLNNKSCYKFFCENAGDPFKFLQDLPNSPYRFLNLGSSSIGASTNPDGTVFINSNGLFVTAKSGNIMLGTTHCDLGSASGARGFILLHELGHQLGMFPPDAAPGLANQNIAHSLDIINHCFPGSCTP